MKMVFAAFLGCLVSFSANAAFTSSRIFSQIVQNEEFLAVETSLAESGYTLNSLSDTGARFRCMCFDIKAEFKNDKGEVIEKTIRVQQTKVEIR